MSDSVKLRGSVRLVLLQALVCAAAVSLTLFAPPVAGEVLLVPLTADGARHAAALATAEDATLIGRGPIEGSIVVRGDGYRIAGRVISAGILPVSASTAGCEQAA